MKIKGLRWMATFLAACMLMGAVPATAFAAKETTEAAETIPQVYRMDDDNDTVRLVIGKTPTLYIGKNGTVSVTLMNMEDKDWIETEIWIASEDDFRNHYSDEITKTEDRDSEESSIVQSMKTIYPFEVTDSLNRHYKVGHVNKKAKKTVNLNVNVKKGLEEGYYPILIYISKRAQGEDGMSSEYAKTIMAWIETKKTTGTSETDEDSSEPVAFALGENQPTPSANYSEVMNFDVNVRNTGYKTAYDVRVDMELSEDITKFPFEINDGNYDRQMGNMNPDQTVAVPFSMAVREKAKSGYYPIKFKIRYRENENGNFAAPIEDTFYVRVYGKDEDDSLDSEAGENERTKARIIVDSFETDPAEIYAGQDFTLKVRMKNASNSIVASNILFTFESETVSDSPVFTTVNGSNSVVVNSLAPGASDTLTIKFSSSPTAEQRSYTITINEQYDSPEFKNAKEAVKIAVGLKQEARLNTGTIEVMPDAISVGEESNVMFSINNTGKVMLYNVNAVFEADSIQKNECYVGNIEPGKSGNVDTMINGIAPTADDGKVKLSITYEDENGKVSTVEKEIQLMVNEDQSMDESNVDDTWSSDDIQPEPSTTDKLKHLAIPVGIVGVVLAAVILVVIRRKKKKAGMDDEIL
ncbi:CARDB domain-containing protein [Clostridium sp. MCC328]|uniref:COG1361 S-layer family protein n=1 Tax=Clostridium sp. MCC328 TaxID=2592642 RepID=UPI0020798A3B|nr:CARDB domain-containing protein [Clostridium sp. MCC328]